MVASLIECDIYYDGDRFRIEREREREREKGCNKQARKQTTYHAVIYVH